MRARRHATEAGHTRHRRGVLLRGNRVGVHEGNAHPGIEPGQVRAGTRRVRRTTRRGVRTHRVWTLRMRSIVHSVVPKQRRPDWVEPGLAVISWLKLLSHRRRELRDRRRRRWRLRYAMVRYRWRPRDPCADTTRVVVSNAVHACEVVSRSRRVP